MASLLAPLHIAVVAAETSQVANKSDEKALLEAIRVTLGVHSAAIEHNTQTLHRNCDNAVARIADYDAMKDRASHRSTT